MYVQIGRKGATFLDLVKLFETQRVLDKRIVKEKGLEGQDLLPMKVLALQVELGELANEWRGFKFWSANREPRYERKCHACKGRGYFAGKKLGRFNNKNIHISEPCLYCEKTGIEARPLLEEYVDCLHFILSIGNDLGFNAIKPYLVTITEPLEVFRIVSRNIVLFDMPGGREHKSIHYENLVSNFFALGKALGFTWDQVEQAYYAKNQINHERQATGY